MLRYGQSVKEISGGALATTNNRMELQAAIEALKCLKEPVAVDFYTDSTYLRSGITEWVPSWKARGWRTAGKKPVKNADLWRQLDELTSKHSITWHWVKGHAGNPDNERCDELVGMEIRKILESYDPRELRRLLAEFQESSDRFAGTLL